jgi:hypothetical protein
MPRYFFHVYHERDELDDEGEEFGCVLVARSRPKSASLFYFRIWHIAGFRCAEQMARFAR